MTWSKSRKTFETQVAVVSVSCVAAGVCGVGDSSSLRFFWPAVPKQEVAGSRATGNFPSTCLHVRAIRKAGSKQRRRLAATSNEPSVRRGGGRALQPSTHKKKGVAPLIRALFTISLQPAPPRPSPTRRSQLAAVFGEIKSACNTFPLSMEAALERIRTKVARPARGYWSRCSLPKCGDPQEQRRLSVL